MRLLITGATGYIGERLVCQARSQGHDVIAASRRPLRIQCAWMPFDFSSASEIAVPSDVDAVVHLAATTSSNAITSDMELHAARCLIEAAGKAGARVIFVSSQTAREDAPTAYGRVKWQIERLVLVAGGCVIRPGQVYGGAERALFGMLVRAVRVLPAIPAFFPAPKVQPVHLDDLVSALLLCAESKILPSTVLCVGAIVPVSFTDFLRTIARGRLRRMRLLIPVPVVLVRMGISMFGVGPQAKLGLDKLTSLLDLPAMETERDMQLLGLSLRSLQSGMARSGDERRRNLIREGNTFFSYVLKTRPAPALVNRYVRCVESIRDGQSLNLPQFTFHFPVTLALLDDSALLSTPSGLEFAWRLNAAVVLAEASIQGARRFLGIGETSGFIACFARMSRAAALELWWRVLRLVVAPILRPILRRARP